WAAGGKSRLTITQIRRQQRRSPLQNESTVCSMRYATMIAAAAAMLGMLSLALARPAPATAPARESFDAIIKGLKEVPSDPSDSELRAKLKDRHNSAVRLLQLRNQEYQKGLRDPGNVFDAARTVVDCKIDLAQSPQERQRVLEEVVNVAKSVEDL